MMFRKEININSTRGFALIEIMIVFLIIGFLLTVSVMSFFRSRELSRARACQENLRQIDGAKETYALEYYLPQGADVDLSDLFSADGTGYLRREPKCPAGGVYTANPIGTHPTCSYYGNESYAGQPKHQYPE